ncbi:hypothetical protein E2C01_020380 [Portunus trituberculatus]|uniref:Ig-like domain-containing protein n=1 Tax=Portunus trituberculatus TaxID=210409 RepID=A0A5B7E307_PORTR|nr:hypothetical protein [Portunus trituberculatus]
MIWEMVGDSQPMFRESARALSGVLFPGLCRDVLRCYKARRCEDTSFLSQDLQCTHLTSATCPPFPSRDSPMTFPTLPLLLLLLAARGTPARPKLDASSSTRPSPLTEVKWSASCSPRVSKLRPNQDAMLACEMYAPNGTSLVWLNNQKQILPQAKASHHLLPPSSEIAVSRKGRRRIVPYLHISTDVYIDCASSKNQGYYSLKLTTPSGHVYTRNFTVILTGERANPAMTCYLGHKRVEQIPRIWQYARRARGKHGESVLLPCRVLERGVNTVTTWYFRGKRLMPGSSGYKYQVQPSGDLLVLETKPKDAGLYTCTVHNALMPYLFDRVHTWLILPKGMPAAP